MGVKREIIFIALFLLVFNFSFVSAQTSSDNIFEKIIDFFKDLFIDEPRLSAPASLLVGSVAYYEFNDVFTDGNTLDSSGNSLTATCTSCPGTTTNSLDNSQAGQYNGVEYFNVNDNSLLRPTQISISVLINKPSHDDWDAVLTKTSDSLWPDGYGMSYYDNVEGVSNNLYFWINGYQGGVANALIPNNQWVHVVGTYDGANVRIYVNGVLQETVTYSTPITHSTSAIEIGRGRGSLDPFNGGIDELIIYNRALSGTEVNNLYLNYTSSSPPTQTCGNNIREGTEVCDGSDLNSQSCTTQGFTGGILSCNPTCSAFVTTSCTSGGNLVELRSSSNVLISSHATIQACVNAATSNVGQTCLVYPGDYPEAVDVNKALTLRSSVLHQARLLGQGIRGTAFKINSDNVIIDGFFTSTYTSEGIGNFGPSPRNNVVIKNNHVYSSGNSIWANGNNWLVENNKLEKVSTYGCVGCDANYIVFFGINHTYRRNFVNGTILANGTYSDICPVSEGGDYDTITCSHTDAMQGFTNTGTQTYIRDILIEENWFTDYGQAIIIQDWNSTGINNITIRNNVMTAVPWQQGGSTTSAPWSIVTEGQPGFGLKNLTIDNNVIIGDGRGGHAIGIRDGAIANVRNNILFNNTVGYNIQGTNQLNINATNNILYQTWQSVVFLGDIPDVNPLFVNINNPLGADRLPFTSDDGVRLQSGSPAINTGVFSSANRDIYGTSRPQGSNWDVGVHEFVSIPTNLVERRDSGNNVLATYTTIQACATAVTAGQTCLVYPGVYRESVSVANSGTANNRITFRSQVPGAAAIDGSELITTSWTQCTAATCPKANQSVVNQIYYTTLPVGNIDGIYTPLIENDNLMDISQFPNPKDPFYFDNQDTYKVMQSMTSTSTSDNFFDQTSSTFWNGAWAALYGGAVTIVWRPITSFSPGTDTISYASAPYTPERVSILNHVYLIDKPGEYSWDTGDNRVYVYPRGNIASNTYYYVNRGNGFNANSRNHITLDGFKIRNLASTSSQGYAPLYSGTFSATGIVFKNNEIYNTRDVNGGAAVTIRTDNTIADNNYVHHIQRGIAMDNFQPDDNIRSRNITIKNNHIYKAGRNGIWYRQSENSRTINNTVHDVKGVHANGISVYQQSHNALIANNLVYDTNIGFAITLQATQNITIFGNVIHDKLNPYGSLTGKIFIINNYYREFQFDTAAMVPGTNYTAMNNIGEASCYDPSSTFSRGYNILTKFGWCSGSTSNYPLGPGEIVGSIDGNGNYKAVDLSTLVVNAPRADAPSWNSQFTATQFWLSRQYSDMIQVGDYLVFDKNYTNLRTVTAKQLSIDGSGNEATLITVSPNLPAGFTFNYVEIWPTNTNFNWDLRPKSGSIAIDAGRNPIYSYLNTAFPEFNFNDISGTSRPQGSNWDVGPYEFISGTLGNCGNGVIESGETCDDNNTNNGDGCSSTCQVETGYFCVGSPSYCRSYPSTISTTSVTQRGITFTFSTSRTVGQYANGDYWVLGPVTINSITPSASGGLNGWMVNPTNNQQQAYDSRISEYNSALMPSLPYNAQIGDSILKSISNTATSCSANNEGCLKNAAVLTVVGSIPPHNGASVFRPPYPGTAKPAYSVQNLTLEILPNLTPVASTNTISSWVNRFGPVQIDYKGGWISRQLRPTDYMPNYGGDNGRDRVDGALRLTLNDSINDKWPLLIAYTQYGIDITYAIQNGQVWQGGAGHDPAARLPGVFSSVILNDTGMKTIIRNAVETAPETDATLFYMSNSTPYQNFALFGGSSTQSGYWSYLNTKSGDRSQADPYGIVDAGDISDPNGGGSPSYQVTLSPVFRGEALVVRLIPELESTFNYPEILQYGDRWVNFGKWAQPDPCAPLSQGGGHNSGTGFCNLDPNLQYFNSATDFACQSGQECGRFPTWHGSYANEGPYGSQFQIDMWNAHRGESCFNNVCGVGENSLNCPYDCGTSTPSCDLTSSSWSQSNVVEGTQVGMNVIASNCAGQNFNYTIYEDDALVDDAVYSFLSTSLNPNWNSFWVNDGVGDPEYYFRTFVVSNASEIITSSNPLLSVSQAPQNQFNSLNFTSNTANNHEYGKQNSLPSNFGSGEFTLELWIKPNQNFPTGPTTQDTPSQLTNWYNGNPTPYSSSSWWYSGNFLLDGHNNNNFAAGTFSLQFFNSGRLRWTFGDGSGSIPSGGLWAVQNSSSASLLDGNWHNVQLVRRFTGASSSTLEMWIDGVLVDTEVSNVRTNMATTYWNSWSGYPVNQDGWFYGAEKQAALDLGIVNGQYEDYKGFVDEVRFWNRAKTTTEIQNQWDESIAGSETGLIGWYAMNGTGTPTSVCNVLNSGNCITLNEVSSKHYVIDNAPLQTPSVGNLVELRTTSTNALVNSFTTIQDCANVAVAGQTCLVYPGTYNERVNTVNSGTANNRITFKSQTPTQAKMYGFNINFDNFIVIEGFNVTRETGANAGAVGIEMKGNNLEVKNNFVYNRTDGIGIWNLAVNDAERAQIFNNVIKNNHVFQSTHHVIITGNNWTVENNFLDKVYYMGGGDGSYVIPLDVDGAVFRRNIMGNTISANSSGYSDICPGHVGPYFNAICYHLDGFHPWSVNGEIFRNVLIEENYIYDVDQAVYLQNTNGPDAGGFLMKNITIRNNVFIGDTWLSGDSGGTAIGTLGIGLSGNLGIENAIIEHNFLSNFGARAFGFNGESTGIVRNNLVYGVGTVYDTQSLTTGVITGGNNWLYSIDWIGGMSLPGDVIWDVDNPPQPSLDPLLSSTTNKFLGPDSVALTSDDGWIITSGSPVINYGLTSQTSKDIFGTSRPQGSNWDIGPYEFVSGGVSGYHVSQTGSGSQTGSDVNNARPFSWFDNAANWNSINDQNDAFIGPGDTIILHGTINSRITMRGSGTSGNKIIIDASDATIQGLDGLGNDYYTLTGGTIIPSGAMFNLGGSSGNIVQQVTIANMFADSENSIAWMPYSQYVTFENNTFLNTMNGIGGDTTFTHDIVIRNNTIKTTTSAVNTQVDVLAFGDAYNILIENNHLVQRTQTGGSCGTACHNDVIQTYTGGGGFSGNPTNWTIRNNLIELDTPTIDDRSWTIMEGFTGEVRIYGNVFLGSNAGGSNGMAIYNGNNPTVYIYGNTYVAKNGPNNMIRLIDSGTFFFANNIVYASGSNTMAANEGATVINNNNLRFGGGGVGWLISDTNADPQFVDYTNNNFRVQSTSPAINTGATLGSPYNIDKDGIIRPQGVGYDKGAYEFVSGNQQFATSITKDGITWTFNQSTPIGQFVNGDYYVIGPVTITSISPNPTTSAPYRHGTVLNLPSFTDESGFDDRTQGNRFNSNMRVYAPINLVPGDSLVSSISVNTIGTIPRVMRPSLSTNSPVQTVSVLTVMNRSLSSDAFRPSYCQGMQKTYYANNLQRSLLPSVPRVSDTPTLAEFEGYFRRPWIDVNQFLFDAPIEYMPDYGREVGFATSYAALLLMENFTAQEKINLTNYIVQRGIDLTGCLDVGYQGWPAWGGHGSGRKTPIILAGVLLNDSRMKNITALYPDSFGEDMHTAYVNQTPPANTWNVAWQGATAVYTGHVGLNGESVNTGWGPYEHLQPSNWPLDGGSQTGEGYRRCCTSQTWIGQALVMHMLNATKIWNHPAFFDYTDRWMFENDSTHVQTILSQTGFDYTASWTRQGATQYLLFGEHPNNQFIDQMWSAYRNYSVTPASCDLTSSSWSQSSVVEGTQVGMNVAASNCAGQNFNYTIYEDDAVVDDAVYSFLSTSLNPNWNSFWVNDGVGDPEYYFRTFVVSNMSEIITSSNPLLSVSQAPTQTIFGLSFEAEQGTLTSGNVGSFVNSGTYISENIDASIPSDGGRASYLFNVTQAGDYVLQARVNATNTASNSFYINIDGEPSDNTDAWDINPFTGFRLVNVSIRGNGNATANEFNPMVFTLSQGVHELIIRGREPDTQLDSLQFIPLIPNVAPAIFKSSMNISNIILSPGPSNSNVSLKLEISDSNGYTNINDSSIIVNFTKAGEITRNGTCTRIVSESSGNFANYSCVGMMQWYDGPGNWTVNTFVRDVNSNSGVNSTGTFVVLANTGISIGISSITFPTLTPGATNQQSNNDPLIISNIGNVNPASLTILARNLTGQIDSSRVIPASLFGTGLTSGNECNLGASDTRQLGNGGNYVTLSNLPGFSLPRGDYISNNALRENFYICLTQVPSNLTSQTYSASGGNAWDIQVG